MQCIDHGLWVIFALVNGVFIFFLPPGVSEGERETATPWCAQQGSDASHHHPAALVPLLPDKDTLPAQERRRHAHTGMQARRATWVAHLPLGSTAECRHITLCCLFLCYCFITTTSVGARQVTVVYFCSTIQTQGWLCCFTNEEIAWKNM